MEMCVSHFSPTSVRWSRPTSSATSTALSTASCLHGSRGSPSSAPAACTPIASMTSSASGMFVVYSDLLYFLMSDVYLQVLFVTVRGIYIVMYYYCLLQARGYSRIDARPAMPARDGAECGVPTSAMLHNARRGLVEMPTGCKHKSDFSYHSMWLIY